MKHHNFHSKSLVFLFFTLIFLILLIKIKTFFNFYDEGFAMFGSTRVLNGDVPYKDFWAIYPPGQFYILAGIIKLFGANLLNARIFDTLIRFLMVIGVFLITKRLAPPRLAFLAALIAGLMLASAGFYSYAVFPAMTLGLWSIITWLVYTEKRHKAWLVLSGVFLGISTIIRWDIGTYAGISLLAAGYLALLTPGLNRPLSGDPQGSFQLVTLFKPIKDLMWVWVPMVTIALLGYAWIGLQSGWKNLFEQVFYFPTSVLHSVRWLPYPSLIPPDLVGSATLYDMQIPIFNFPSEDWFRFYLPILTLGIAVVLLVISFLKDRTRLNQGYFTLIALTLFGGLLFNQALSRYDLIHVTPASILTFIIAAAFIQQFSSKRMATWVKNCLVALVIGLTILYFAPSLKELLSSLDSAAPWGCYSSLKIAGCVSLGKDEEQAAEFLQANTLPSEPIFVGNQKHDRIFINDIGLYYLAGRESGTRYHELYPGVATTLPVQTEIALEIGLKDVKWIALVKIWDSNEPNKSALSSGVTYLDDYLRSHYLPVTEFGNYQILKRVTAQP
ncbi:MAG TPA: glycosyltransferase family 39 protein [Anaerolineaceae bacterium]